MFRSGKYPTNGASFKYLHVLCSEVKT